MTRFARPSLPARARWHSRPAPISASSSRCSRERASPRTNGTTNCSPIGDVAILRNYDLDKPIIAAVNGFCIAGGMELIQATDLRVASENASFGLQEVKWAIIPAAGSLARLQRQMPYCKAMEILLIGNRIDAQEAWRLGLINYVVPQAQLMAKAEELAAAIAANGPLAVRKIKEAVRRCSGRPLEEAFKIENECAREVMKSEDAKEGPRAFMEKRQPNYKGR